MHISSLLHKHHLLLHRSVNHKLTVYSQEHSFHVHTFHLDQPGSKPVTGCVSKVDHGLREGVGKAVHVGFLLGVPAARGRRALRSERKSTERPTGKLCGGIFLRVRNSQVFFVQGLKLELPVEGDDCTDVLDGLRGDLLGDTLHSRSQNSLMRDVFHSNCTERLQFDLSCRLQLLLVFGGVSSQDLDISGSSEGDDGHDGQDEQRQLPAVDKGDDDADADVGEVLHQCRQTSASSLE